MKKVAITGGLSSGKSTVCNLLKEEGAYCVSADEIVHQLLTPHTPVGQQIVQLLGQGIVQNEKFDKEKIASLVFQDKEALKALESILHPAVLSEVDAAYEKAKQTQKYKLFVAEIPLLYEIEKQDQFDAVVAITAPLHLAASRFQKRTNQSTEEFEKRMTHQLPLEEKSARADYTLSNHGDLSKLKDQVQTLYQTLTK